MTTSLTAPLLGVVALVFAIAICLRVVPSRWKAVNVGIETPLLDVKLSAESDSDETER